MTNAKEIEKLKKQVDYLLERSKKSKDDIKHVFKHLVYDVELASQYGSTKDSTTLAAAITAIGSNKKILYIDGGEWTLTSNHSFPDNITLWVAKGSFLSWTTDITITIRHIYNVTDIDYKIFSCPVAYPPVLGEFYYWSVGSIRPEWFGAINDGATNSTNALQLAIKCACKFGGIVQLPEGEILVNVQITLRVLGDGLNFCTIRGKGMDVSIITFWNGGVQIPRGFVVDGVDALYFAFEDFSIYGNGGNGLQKAITTLNSGTYSYTRFIRVKFFAPAAAGIEGSAGITNKIIECVFGAINGIALDLANNINTWVIDKCVFTQCYKAIRANDGYAIAIRSCQFDNCKTYAIHLGSFIGFAIDNNYFEWCGDDVSGTGGLYNVGYDITIKSPIILNGYNDTNLGTTGPMKGGSITNNFNSPATPVASSPGVPFISLYACEGVSIIGNGCHPDVGDGSIMAGLLIQILNPPTSTPTATKLIIASNSQFTAPNVVPFDAGELYPYTASLED